MDASRESDSGSKHDLSDHRFVGGGIFNPVCAPPAVSASFEIIEHSAFRSSLSGVGRGGDSEFCRLGSFRLILNAIFVRLFPSSPSVHFAT